MVNKAKFLLAIFSGCAGFGRWDLARSDVLLNSYTDLNAYYAGSGYNRGVVTVDVECDDLARRGKLSRELTDEQRRKVEERRIAVLNNDLERAARLSGDTRELNVKLKRNLIMTEVIESVSHDFSLQPFPSSAKVKFLLAQSRSVLGSMNPLRGALHYKRVWSRVPVDVRWDVDFFGKNRANDVARATTFQIVDVPNVATYDKYPNEDRYSSMRCGNSPICLRVENEPYGRCDWNRADCSLFDLSEVQLRLSQGQLCGTSSDIDGVVFIYTVRYSLELLGPEVVEVTYHFGYDVTGRTSVKAENAAAENAAIDRFVKEFIIDVLGESQSYRVSDQPFLRLGQNYVGYSLADLRDALNLLNDKVSAASGLIQNSELLNYFKSDLRYTDEGFGNVAFVFDKDGSRATMVFSRVADGVSLVGLSFNEEEIPFRR